jgi:hypothetical protein
MADEEQSIDQQAGFDDDAQGDDLPPQFGAAPPARQQYQKKRPLPPSAPAPTPKRQAPAPSADRLKQLAANAAPMASASSNPAGDDAGSPKPLPGIHEHRDDCMFYPDTYHLFDPENLFADGDPQTSRMGGGKMIFLGYKYPNGQTRPLCVQAPKLFMPGGIKEFQNREGGSKIDVNALCSLGKDWQQNPQLVAFKEVCDKIQTAVANIVVAKKQHLPHCRSVEDVLASMAKIVCSTEKWTEEDPPRKIEYPPAIKLTVNRTTNNKSLLVARLQSRDGAGPKYGEIQAAGVCKGSSIIPMICFNWVYRKQKSNPTGWSYNIRSSIYQAIVEPVAAFGANADRLVVSC